MQRPKSRSVGLFFLILASLWVFGLADEFRSDRWMAAVVVVAWIITYGILGLRRE
jgi:hypothetical protein